MKLTKEKIKKIFDSKELVSLIDKYITEWDKPLPSYINNNNNISNAIDEYFVEAESNILNRIDDILSYITDDEESTSDWDIYSSYYDFCDFLMDLKEHYKNNSDMEWE